jgi:hypothetical protein
MGPAPRQDQVEPVTLVQVVGGLQPGQRAVRPQVQPQLRLTRALDGQAVERRARPRAAAWLHVDVRATDPLSTTAERISSPRPALPRLDHPFGCHPELAAAGVIQQGAEQWF